MTGSSRSGDGFLAQPASSSSSPQSNAFATFRADRARIAGRDAEFSRSARALSAVGLEPNLLLRRARRFENAFTLYRYSDRCMAAHAGGVASHRSGPHRERADRRHPRDGAVARGAGGRSRPDRHRRRRRLGGLVALHLQVDADRGGVDGVLGDGDLPLHDRPVQRDPARRDRWRARDARSCRRGAAGASARGVKARRAEVACRRTATSSVTFLRRPRSEEHTSELQSRPHLVCRLLLEKKKNTLYTPILLKKKKYTLQQN